MKTSRQKILLACIAMLMAMVGDYLMGYNTGGFSDDGITMNVVSDLRYAASSLLGFLCMPLFAIAALELLKVMETKYKLQDKKLYKLFKFGNWSGILYFAFVHIGLCMLPVVYNAGMEATADPNASMDMFLRVGKSILIPLLIAYLTSDIVVLIAWVGMVVKGHIPVKKIFLICNPLVIAIIGNLANLIHDGLDSGFESFGWLLMYLVCAMCLVNKTERV